MLLRPAPKHGTVSSLNVISLEAIPSRAASGLVTMREAPHDPLIVSNLGAALADVAAATLEL